MILTMLHKNKIWKEAESDSLVEYIIIPHLKPHFTVCIDKFFFCPIVFQQCETLVFESEKSQVYNKSKKVILNHCTSEDHDIPNISPYGTHLVQVDVSLTVLLLVNKSLTMALKNNISHWSLYIFNQLIALAGEESHNVIPIRITLTIFGRRSPELCYKQNMKVLVSHLLHVIFLFNVK